MSGKVSLRIRYERRSGLVGLLALALLVAALLGYLAWGQREAVASGLQAPLDHARDRPLDHARDRPLDHARDRPLDHPFDLAQGRARDRPFDRAQDKPLATSAGLRGYYLTESTYNGAQADGTDGNGAGVCASGYHFASLWEILDPSNLKYDTGLGMVRDDSGQGPPTFPYFGGWVRTGYASSSSSTPGTGNCNAWTSSDSGDYGTTAYLPNDWTAGQDIHAWAVDTATCDITAFIRVWCVADNVSTPVYLPLILKNSF